ncbi:dATP/dGTP diphosphohydrolase domain-containing protein [Aquabacterium sp.]|uniref:dATP/dGTP diphosphohydrolase domain-containing protein n=1 Tax=Aquabacterium sp. TaxID=1872578 RepID=UPI004037E1AC
MDEVAPQGGMKFDGDKPMLALLPVEALEEIGKVLTFGAKKYAAHNWRKGFVWSRLLSATLRHTFAFIRGEDKDPETGLSHLAHAACCLLFLLSFTKTGAGEDDRFRVDAVNG